MPQTYDLNKTDPFPVITTLFHTYHKSWSDLATILQQKLYLIVQMLMKMAS